MAGSKSDYLEAKMLDLVLGAVAYSPPANVYVALLTDSNTQAQRDAGTVTEVPTATWTNYARIVVPNNPSNWSRTGSTTTNVNAISFGNATTTANVNVTAFGIYDALTGGNLLYHADLVGAPVVVQNTNPVSFAAGAITVTED